MNFSRKNHDRKKENKRFMSKTLQILFVMLAICISNSTQAQTLDDLLNSTEEESTENNSSTNPDNLLDMQSHLFTDLFGEDLDGNSTGNSIGFLELLEKLEMPADQKQHYREMYMLQAKNFTERQKDSLGRAFGRKIMEAEKD